MLENTTLKRIVAGLLALSIVTGASPVQKGIGGKTRCVAIASDTEGANAPYWDADTQTLHLSGSNWTKNEDVILNYKEQAINIVGGEGTTYDPQHIDGEYARVDADEEPGYLTTTVYYEMVDAKEPTCTEDGNIKYYMEPDGRLFTNRKGTRLSDRNGDGYVDLNDTVIPKTGHNFGEPIVSNNADGSISAVFTCEKCGDTKEVILSADEITALLENAYMATVTWDWAEDYIETSVSISDIPVEALELISDDGLRNYIAENGLTFQAVVTSEETDATCVTDGSIKYTATAYSLSDEITVPGEPASGHEFGEPEWFWSDDYKSAYAVFTCEKCGKTETVNAHIKITKQKPTYSADGEITYSALLQFNEIVYSNYKSETIPKLERTDLSNAEISFINGDTLVENGDYQEIKYDVIVNGETLYKYLDYDIYEGDEIASKPGTYVVKLKAVDDGFEGEKTFTWKITPAELTVTVNGEPIEEEVEYDSSITITAPEPEEGMKFSHWEENGEVVSYLETYSFIVMKSVDLVPVYVKEDDIVEAQAILSISASQSKYDSKRAIQYTFNHSLPYDYTVKEIGLLYGTNKLAGADTSVEKYGLKDLTNEEEALSVGVIDIENVIKNNTTGNIKKYVANYKKNEGTLVFSYAIGSNFNAYTYAIGYIKVKNAEGEEEILYTDLIATSYNGLNN